MKNSKDVAAGDWIEWTADHTASIDLRKGSIGRVLARSRLRDLEPFLRVAFDAAYGPTPDELYGHDLKFWCYHACDFKIIPDPRTASPSPEATPSHRRYTGLFDLSSRSTVWDVLAKQDTTNDTGSS